MIWKEGTHVFYKTSQSFKSTVKKILQTKQLVMQLCSQLIVSEKAPNRGPLHVQTNMEMRLTICIVGQPVSQQTLLRDHLLLLDLTRPTWPCKVIAKYCAVVLCCRIRQKLTDYQLSFSCQNATQSSVSVQLCDAKILSQSFHGSILS